MCSPREEPVMDYPFLGKNITDYTNATARNPVCVLSLKNCIHVWAAFYNFQFYLGSGLFGLLLSTLNSRRIFNMCNVHTGQISSISLSPLPEYARCLIHYPRIEGSFYSLRCYFTSCLLHI